MVADPQNGSAMILPLGGDEEGIVMQFIVSSEPNATILMKYLLPTMLLGNEISGQIGCEFTSTSLLRMTTKELLNPNDSIIFVMNLPGRDTFYLGIKISVPVNIPPDVYSGAVICSVKNLGTDETDNATENYNVEVEEIPLCVTAQDGYLERLTKNITYNLFPVTDFISPKIRGDETGTSLTLTVSGVPYAQVVIDFILPTLLRGTSTLFCSFSSTSLYYVEGGGTVNPNTLAFFNIGGEGYLHLRLGITLLVPSNINNGEYTGEVVCQVVYAGPQEGVESNMRQQQSCNFVTAKYSAFVGMPNVVNDVQPASPEFHLEQNYPNPFNPLTVISYQLPVKSSVSLEVYDLLGREVTILLNEVQDAGEHSVYFDGTNFSGGLYLYRLRAEKFSTIKKLLLVK